MSATYNTSYSSPTPVMSREDAHFTMYDAGFYSAANPGISTTRRTMTTIVLDTRLNSDLFNEARHDNFVNPFY